MARKPAGGTLARRWRRCRALAFACGLVLSIRAEIGAHNSTPCKSADGVNSPGCWKHRSDAELNPLLKGTAAHPFAFPVVCGVTVDTPAKARTILATGGSSPCDRWKRDALTTILNIRRSILYGDGKLGDDPARCFGADDFCIVLKCGSFFVPDTSTSDPHDAVKVTENTPISRIVDYGNQLCTSSSCPSTNNSTCGKTLGCLAQVLNDVNDDPNRHGDCFSCSKDRTPPVLDCPVGTIDIECTGSHGAPIHYKVTATDNCDKNPSVCCYPPPGTVISTGTMRQVDCTAKDDAGNESKCWFKVRVVDTTPPVICCPKGPVVVDCVSGGNGNGAFVTYPMATAWDVCDPHPKVVCVPASGSFFPFGITTVKCTATDHSGNMSMCTFEVEVTEATPPALTCPGDITVECASPGGAVVDYPPPMVSSTCGMPAKPVCVPPSGSLFPIGATKVVCSTTDSHGKKIECSFTVTVVDTHPPVITCPPDVAVECAGPNGTPVGYQVGAVDECDDHPVVTCDSPSGSDFPLGETIVHCTAKDHEGNHAECSFKVTVADTKPPEITCPVGPVIAHCATGGPPPGAIVNYPPPVATDTCDEDVTLVCVPPSGSTFPLGSTTVTCKATDGTGNMAMCTFEVLVLDAAPPMLVCPGDLSVECSGSEGAIVEYPPPVLADECDEAVTVTCTPPSGSLFPPGPTVVACRAMDASGNPAECRFTVTVGDNTPPQILCPANKIVECASPFGTAVEFSVVVSDACDPVPASTCDPPSGSLFPVGLTVVECTAMDASGNESRCKFTVSVVDTKPPEVACPDPIVAECQGIDGAVVTFAASATDECAGTAEVTCVPPSGSVFPPGTTKVTCTAMDPSGNTSQCDFEVTVVDRTPPTISCPQDVITLECAGGNTAEAAYPLPSASDLCDSSPSVVCDPPAGTPLGLGTHTIVCTARDAAGNTAQCRFDVQVVDNGVPSLNCPSDIVRECEGPDGAVVTYASPTPSDTCDPAPSLVCLPPSGSLFPIGETTVTCTADDQAGNMVQCSFKVRVVDGVPPQIQCPSDKILQCASPDGTTVSYTVTATDLCDPAPIVTCVPPPGSIFPIGTTTVNCTARDRSGNESKCSFQVTVRDDLPPTISCPEGFETDCVENGMAMVVYPAPRVSDDCDASPTVVCDPPSGTRLPIGPHVIRCTAMDDAGNSSSCEFTVTVVDRTLPALVCPPPVTVECDQPDGTIVTYASPIATDTCDAQPVVTCVPPSGSLFPLGASEVVCTAKDRDGNTMQCTFIVTVVDKTPPDVSCPAPITTDRTSPDGANVEFRVTVSDLCDPNPTLTCNPPSGSLFPIGTTTVSCTAEDAAGNESECSFTVTVEDRTPPEIRCPPDLTLAGTTSGTSPHKPPGWPPGSNPPANEITASVFYDKPTATDPSGTEALQVTCDPPSGTRLGFGTHTIACRARDASGNEATCTFQVTVNLGAHAFIRADSNGDAHLDIGDPIHSVSYLFMGTPAPKCLDAADANDDGKFDLTDVIFELNYIFRGGPEPATPFFPFCGLDGTPDTLGCHRFLPCE